LTREQAIAELERGAGTQFDPAVVETFLALVRTRGEELIAPAQATGESRKLAAVRASRGKG
jgi:HD-GYP domain-containing protein (c-di-GMP phosphodiesterase class II)